MLVMIKNIGVGEGLCKKSGEQQAAKNALVTLKQLDEEHYTKEDLDHGKKSNRSIHLNYF